MELPDALLVKVNIQFLKWLDEVPSTLTCLLKVKLTPEKLPSNVIASPELTLADMRFPSESKY